MRPVRRKKVHHPFSAPTRIKWLARALAWAIAAILALLIVANSSVFWEKGLESLLPGAELEVIGISTDVITMVAAQKVLYDGKLPSIPLVRITGRDVFLAYDPLLRKDLAIDVRSVAVESILQPAAEAGPGTGGIPLLGSFHNVRMFCPDLSLRVAWKDWSASCDGSKLVCAWPSSGTCTTLWDMDSLNVYKEETSIADFRDVSVSGNFERGEGLDLPIILAGAIEARCGRMDVDMEALSGLGKREKIVATGKFTGTAHAAFAEGGLKELEIELFSDGGGSVVVARDFINGYIERIPSRVQKESMKIVLENLQDYAFNTGVIHIMLVGDIIEVDIDLEGEGGSRKLSFGFHDFIEDGRLAPNPLFSIGR